MSLQKTALLVGATGLVGRDVLQLLLDSDTYKEVKVLARRTTEIEHPKLKEFLVDFEFLAEYANEMKADDIYCCLGITKAKAGSIEKARKVEYDYPLEMAQIALRNGAQQFLIITSIAANAQSKNYYLRTKGQIEIALQELGYKSVLILRPSLLVGDRGEIRLGEDFMRVVSTAFSFFIPNKYKAIRSRTVAEFMYRVAQKGLTGHHIFESDTILRIEKKRFNFEAFEEKTEYRDL